MGWYIALACGGALAPDQALHLINSMGNLMHQQQTGGQLIYPLVDEDWKVDSVRIQAITQLKNDIQRREGCELYESIRLGGFEVLAGNEAGLKSFSQELVANAPYPIRLPGHGSFHSPMMQPISDQARARLSKDLFTHPDIPLIDGRGQIWEPLSSDPVSLWDYTLGTQIVHTYDYTRAIQNALKELAPDCLILLGPGNSMGAVTAQAMIEINWQGLNNKQDFTARQASDPIILSMGLSTQRQSVEHHR
jgi:acyl transferase domain-containing protein